MSKQHIWEGNPVRVPVLKSGKVVKRIWVYKGDKITDKQLQYIEEVLGIKPEKGEQKDKKGGKDGK